ncbi:MAG: hypothetical protein WCH99_16010 [Verrucomicrobiota bacterium]
MSFANPTRLRIGMHANFGGRDYRLIGRVVMGVTDDGETYYWNEFNLEARDGSCADLVCEETERGAEWRLFTMFEPEYPMTAADAATKRVGDSLNLTGTDVRVTLRDTSRVYHIEGKAPEGVETGDVANYFNAEAGEIMQVVSWTGEEIEFYNGVNLTSGVVNSAFNLPQEPTGFAGNFSGLSGSASNQYDSGLKFLLKAGGVIILFLIIFGRGLSCSTNHAGATVKRIAAGAPPLSVGAAGKWHDKNYRITAHAVVEIARVGLIFDRHEYELTDDSGMKALLVCGDQPKAGDWAIYEPFLMLLPPPTASQLAAMKTGDFLKLDGFSGKVSELFRSTIKQTDGDVLSAMKPGTVTYGLTGTGEYLTLLARWNRDGQTVLRGQSQPAGRVSAGFSSAK